MWKKYIPKSNRAPDIGLLAVVALRLWCGVGNYCTIVLKLTLQFLSTTVLCPNHRAKYGCAGNTQARTFGVANRGSPHEENGPCDTPTQTSDRGTGERPAGPPSYRTGSGVLGCLFQGTTLPEQPAHHDTQTTHRPSTVT